MLLGACITVCKWRMVYDEQVGACGTEAEGDLLQLVYEVQTQRNLIGDLPSPADNTWLGTGLCKEGHAMQLRWVSNRTSTSG